MDLQKRMDLIKKSPTEEVITEEDLKKLLETNSKPAHYQGFEISGFLHLGSLIVSGMKINDLIKAGVSSTVYLADWHSYINNKLGRDWEKIKMAAKYYEEAFKFFCKGVKIVHGSDLYHNNDEYWKDVIRFSTNMTLQRNLRAVTIMGRNESDKLDMAQLFYPPMQGVDIKHIGADIAHGGMEQRKIHVLAREIYPSIGWEKPVALHHHLLMGLAEPEKTDGKDVGTKMVEAKMSKSKPWTAIFIHDSEKEIQEKMKKAWCPERQTDMNPVLELAKYIIFNLNDSFKIERPAKFGGNVKFDSYESLEKAYAKGDVHPVDLKSGVATEINKIIEPVRKHFEKPANKKLLEVYKDLEITR